MKKSFFKFVLITLSALMCLNYVKADNQEIVEDTWERLYLGSIREGGHAVYEHNGFLYVSVWDFTKPENEMGKLYLYRNRENSLTPFGSIVLKNVPTNPDDIGYQNFLGFTSDGTYIYGVNMSQNIFVIDPEEESIVDLIRLEPEIGLTAIAYDYEREGFWGTDFSGNRVWFIGKDGTVYDGRENDEIFMGTEENTITGLAYDDISEGGPYLWTNVGYSLEENVARIGRFHIPSQEYTSEIIDVRKYLGYSNVASMAMSNMFIYQDYTLRKLVLASIVATHNLMFGIDLADISGSDSPRKIDDFEVISDEFAAFGARLTWTNPAKKMDGSELEQLTSVVISRDGEPVHVITNPVVGQKESWRDENFTQKGLYNYSIVSSNDAGEGLPAYKSVFIGENVPAAVRNITLERLNSLTCKISWTAPTTGRYGGWIHEKSLTYTVTRMPDNVVVAQNLTETEFTDNTISEMDLYSYLITSFTREGEGLTVTSPSIRLGDSFNMPWSENFIDQDKFNELWTIIDANNDGYTWSYVPATPDGSAPDRMYCGNSMERQSDDWMISPALTLEAGKSYWLRLKPHLSSGAVFNITMGKGNTIEAQNINIASVTLITDFTPLSIEIIVDETGEYNIGFHAITTGTESHSIHIADLSMREKPEFDMGALSITGPSELIIPESGEYTVHLSNYGSVKTNNFKLHLWYLDENNSRVNIETKEVNSSTEVSFNFAPTVAAGKVDLYATIDYEADKYALNDTARMSLEIYPEGTVKIKIGEEEGGVDNTTNIMPFNPSYTGSVSQSLYLDSEINKAGVINKIEYSATFSNYPVNDRPVKIYLCTTSQNDMTLEWLVADTVLVYDGLLNIPGGNSIVSIPLDYPYLYNGGNLAVLVVSNHSIIFSEYCHFYITHFDTQRSRVMSKPGDFEFREIGRLVYYTPVTTFVMNERGAKLSGVVKDSDGSALNDVTIQIQGTKWITKTDSEGNYEFPFIPASDENYVIEVSKTGYTTETRNLTMVIDNKVEDFTLNALNKITVNGKIVNESDAQVENANILLKGNGNYQVLTNSNGEFVIEEVFVPGTYNIEVYKNGYIHHEDIVDIQASNATLPDITLTACSKNAPRSFRIERDAQEWHKVYLSWIQPIGIGGDGIVTIYNIYLDGMLKHQIFDSRITLTDIIAEGTHKYEISAVWESGCESARVAANITIEKDPWQQTVTEFPFSEDFETGKLENYWREKYMNSNYTGVKWNVIDYIEAMIGYGKDDFVYLYAYEGNYFANLAERTSANNRTRLMSPVMDLTQINNPYLSFWMLNYPSILSETDELIIYYKNSPEGEWIPITGWYNTMKDWTKRTVRLPNPTDTYWIAFDANNTYGYGISLDNIKVYDADVCAEVNSLKYSQVPATNNIKLEWLAPDATNITSYTILREGAGIIADNVKTLYYTDENLLEGTYSYTVKANYNKEDCTQSEGSSIEVRVRNLVDLEEIHMNAIAVYPNPAKETLFVEAEGMEKVEVYTMAGGYVETIQLNSMEKRHQVDLNQYDSGLYVFKFYNNSGASAAKRVMINK